MANLKNLFNLPRQLIPLAVSLWSGYWQQYRPPTIQITFGAFLIPLSTAPKGKPLQTFLKENPSIGIPKQTVDFAIQQLTEKLERGIVPALCELVKAFPSNMESKKSRQLLGRMTYFLSLAGEPGKVRSIALQLKARKRQQLQLQDTYFRYEWGSTQEHEIRLSLSHLESLIAQTENLLIPLLKNDPSQGKECRLEMRSPRARQWLAWLQFQLGSSERFA